MLGSLRAAAVYNERGVPKLFVGGPINLFGEVPSLSGIAAWDGVSWSSVGGGVSGSVEALAVFDDGSGLGDCLYVGGGFGSVNGVTGEYIARWDGVTWTRVGENFDGLVLALEVLPDPVTEVPTLFAGGQFRHIGGVPVNGVAKWNGVSWLPLGSGVSNGFVSSIARFGPEAPACSTSFAGIYIGGEFESAGGIAAKHIARWDGTTWNSVGGGMGFTVYDMEVRTDPISGSSTLFAGGIFLEAGGTPVDRIAEWDGQSWHPVGAVSPVGIVNNISVFDDGAGDGPCVYVGGEGGTSIGRWNGSEWSVIDDLAGGSFMGFIKALTPPQSSQPSLLVGAVNAGTALALWNGESWTTTDDGFSAPINAIETIPDGSGGADVVVGGSFSSLDFGIVRSVASWDGQDWASLGAGVVGSGPIRDLHWAPDGAAPAAGLYAATDSGVIRWNGAEWRPVGAAIGSVWAVCSGSGRIYAGGSPGSWPGFPGGVQQWDGSTWTVLGSGVNSLVTSLVEFDDGSGSALFAAGYFSIAGGQEISGIAKWKDGQWLPVRGNAEPDRITSMTIAELNPIDGPQLFAAGSFDSLDGAPFDGIARWDGQAWHKVGAVSGSVLALCGLPTDPPALLAGGAFTSIGGIETNAIARWNGVNWAGIGQGIPSGHLRFVPPEVRSIVAVPGEGQTVEVWLGGRFVDGPLGSSHLARWMFCPESCPADFNADGQVGGDDLATLLGSWGTSSPGVDLDGSPPIGGGDLAVLLGSWGACN